MCRTLVLFEFLMHDLSLIGLDLPFCVASKVLLSLHVSSYSSRYFSFTMHIVLLILPGFTHAYS